MRHVAKVLVIILGACGTPRPKPPSPPPDCVYDAKPPDEGAPPDPVPPDEDPPPEPRVVLVVVDGLRSDLAATMPAWNALAADGAWTLRARTERLSVTVVSHAVIFTGVGPEKNGVRTHEPGGDADLAAWRPLKVADTIFTAAGDVGMGTGAVIRKQKLRGLLPEESVDAVVFAKDDLSAVEAACALLVDDDATRLLYVHVSELDAVGHSKGWMSKAQKAAAVRVSDRLAELRACTESAELAWKQPVYLLVTSDHGGHGRTHGKDVDTDRLVPWALVGPGVAIGHELSGTIRLVDTAAVVLTLLGIADGIPGLEGRIPEGLFDP